MIPVANPTLSGNEKKYVNECIDTTWISSAGHFITDFEREFAKISGTKHVVATNNGTTALHLALAALGIGPGDEVIVPTMTYVASANAVRYVGATVVLVDSEPDTLNIDPIDVERKITERTKAIIPVHLYGRPADMTAIMEIAKRHNLFVIEDAAEAHGAQLNGQPVGSFGDLATFSFFGNKIVTTGEGGAVTTNNDKLADYLRILRGQGMDPNHRYWFPFVGFNFRMTNVAAAIGVAQLEQFDDFVARRDEIEAWYNGRLDSIPDIQLPAHRPGTRPVNWCYTIIVNDFSESERDKLMIVMRERGVDTRPVFYPLHLMPPYFEEKRYPIAEKLGASGLSLPTFVELTQDDVNKVCDVLIAAIEEIRADR